MDDSVDVASSLELVVCDKNQSYCPHDDKASQLQSVYIGQSINVFVLVKYCPEQDPNSDLEAWHRRIGQLGVHGCLTPAPRPEDDDEDESSLICKDASISDDSWDFGQCKICLSFTEGSDSRTVSLFHLKQKPYFYEETVYVIPLSLSLTSVPGDCNHVQLSVAVWLSQTPTPTEWMTLEKDFCLSPDSFSGLPPPPKTVTKQSLGRILDIIQPPQVKFHLTEAAGKQLILLKVHNSTDEDLTVSNCWVLPSSCHWATRSPTEPSCDHLGRDCDDNHGQKVSLLKTTNSTFPLQLSPREVFSLIFTIQDKELDGPNTSSFFESSSSSISGICCFFNVTYTISNKLQDFLALRLYWSPSATPAIMEMKEGCIRIKKPKEITTNSIICQDPDVLLGSCPKGTTLTAAVRFQVLQPGLFEVGQHMKLNLRYALPSSTDSQLNDVSTPTDSISTLSPDEQLMASEELWRERSGSTSSVRSTGLLSCDERRRSFATKSYSFGDLGPASSTDSDTGRQKKFKNIERSPRVPPPRPPPPKRLPRAEQALNNPRNFLKKSHQIYIPQLDLPLGAINNNNHHHLHRQPYSTPSTLHLLSDLCCLLFPPLLLICYLSLSLFLSLSLSLCNSVTISVLDFMCC
ncbi:unnamed protein product [Acanthosepion pharaonis]|uniref:Uncharacterized protein n=1 Tax=Acanthosepion pharaonis TaxID=158019 RepID=A0A812DQZ0_ACAPH|nr:unnamed protein product [Sepia pharaonis]